MRNNIASVPNKSTMPQVENDFGKIERQRERECYDKLIDKERLWLERDNAFNFKQRERLRCIKLREIDVER